MLTRTFPCIGVHNHNDRYTNKIVELEMSSFREQSGKKWCICLDKISRLTS